MTTAVIFIAGPMPPLDARPGDVPRTGVPATTLGDRMRARIEASAPAFAVAADGGADLARSLGFEPRYVVGDMDSVSESALSAARQRQADIREFPVAKDASDYELALDLASSNGADHLVIIGGASGRLDHVIATVLTLASSKYAGLTIEAWLVDNYLAVVNGQDTGCTDTGVGVDMVKDTARDVVEHHPDLLRSPSNALLQGSVGDHVSLFAVNGPASGVRTEGLRWSLNGATLHPGSSIGISNELVQPHAAVCVQEGTLVIVKSMETTDEI